MKITLQQNGNFDSDYTDNTNLSPVNLKGGSVVVVPDSIFHTLKQKYKDAGHDVETGLHGLPSPLTVLTGDDLITVQKETDTYNLRQEIYALKSEKSQLGMANDMISLLIKGMIELANVISTNPELKIEIDKTSLSGLIQLFSQINPDLPPIIKGMSEVAVENLNFMNDVAQKFK